MGHHAVSRHFLSYAYACGFADHSAFTRRFRAEVGVAPLEFGRRARRLMRDAERRGE